MKKNMKIIKIITGVALATTCLIPNVSYALGQVSRACRFDLIPDFARNISARFAYAVGAPDWVLDLPTSAHMQDYWALEAITTDYLRARYYLFARRYLFYLTSADPVNLKRYYSFEAMMESPWTEEEISSAMKSDPIFRPFYMNRGLWFSARAGHPDILEYRPGHTQQGAYYVIGTHWYMDLSGGAKINLPNSEASTCNLTNWGIGLWDR